MLAEPCSSQVLDELELEFDGQQQRLLDAPASTSTGRSRWPRRVLGRAARRAPSAPRCAARVAPASACSSAAPSASRASIALRRRATLTVPGRAGQAHVDERRRSSEHCGAEVAAAARQRQHGHAYTRWNERRWSRESRGKEPRKEASSAAVRRGQCSRGAAPTAGRGTRRGRASGPRWRCRGLRGPRGREGGARSAPF